MRYFRAENVTQPIAGVMFQKTRVICGCVWGVVATEDPAVIAAIEAMIVKGHNGLVEINEDDYLVDTQKKIRDLIRPIDSADTQINASSPARSAQPAPGVVEAKIVDIVRLGESPPPVIIPKKRL